MIVGSNASSSMLSCPESQFTPRSFAQDIATSQIQITGEGKSWLTGEGRAQHHYTGTG
jgi:hypothetical protein